MGSKETKHKPLCGWSVAVAFVSCASAFVVNWTMNGAVQSTEKKCCDYRIQTFKKWLLLIKNPFLCLYIPHKVEALIVLPSWTLKACPQTLFTPWFEPPHSALRWVISRKSIEQYDPL